MKKSSDRPEGPAPSTSRQMPPSQSKQQTPSQSKQPPPSFQRSAGPSHGLPKPKEEPVESKKERKE